MHVHPQMDIYYSEGSESKFRDAMKRRAKPPWRWQANNPFGKPAGNDSLFFHRDKIGSDPGCTVCIHRANPGHMVVTNVTPDEMGSIPRDQYVHILQDFDSRIAEASAQEFGGMTSIGTATHTLEDYFSTEAIGLLERYCDSPQGDRDEDLFIDFLRHLHENDVNVHCDTFGACLKAKSLVTEDAISDLVRKYDFGMRVLRGGQVG